MFRHRAQLRFSDSDALGHVNHARFATLFEDARVMFLRDLAPEGEDMLTRGLILARLEIDYVRPLQLSPDPVSVGVWVTRVGERSFDLAYELEQFGDIAGRARTVLVAYDYAAAGSRDMTADERSGLLQAVQPSSAELADDVREASRTPT